MVVVLWFPFRHRTQLSDNGGRSTISIEKLLRVYAGMNQDSIQWLEGIQVGFFSTI
jgi:hypothetical protein